MKKLLLLVLSVLIFSGAGPKKSWLGYYDQILLIEQLIAKERFPEALRAYSSLFKKYKKIPARDAYNACQIAAIANDPSFDEFYGWCGSSGVSRRLLKRNFFISGKTKADTFAYGVVHSKGLAEYYKGIDTALRREFMERARKEVQLQGKPGLKEVCFDNFERIRALCAKNKFPGEQRIGVDENLENIVMPTLINYPYSYTALRSCLEKSLEEGGINPLQNVFLYCNNQARNSTLYTVPKDTVNFNTIYNLQIGPKSQDIIEVNKARKEKRIQPYETEIQLRNVIAKYGLNYKPGI